MPSLFDIPARFSGRVEPEPNFRTRLNAALDGVRQVLEVLPSSREVSLALTKLDEARHWALEARG